MQLTDKVSQLETDAVTAKRLADFWRRQIDTYGEPRATAFYRHLGLNHIETKSVDFDGLTLSREPNEAEKLCVKSIAQAQEASQASVTAILTEVKTELVEQGIKAIKKLAPADYHTLTLEASPEYLRSDLESIFKTGRKLVASEIRSQKEALPQLLTDGDEEVLDELADVTISRVVNDVQGRIAAAVARYRLLGLRGPELWAAVADEMERGSVAYIDRAARGVSNRVLNFGRFREMEDRADEIGRYQYSAILDNNTCGPCSADDGQEASSPDELPSTPNPECEGSDFCRCFIVTILDTVA